MKKKCTEGLMDMVIGQLRIMSDGQIDGDTRNQLLSFDMGSTPQEKYDLLADISRKDVTQISNFIRSLCDVKRYYLRPG